ncbi:cache domain-containing protein [Pseudomonas nitroreducens]|uniref:cache domain-containing protein n=1 Tax=Pseudomonas nitroreducens TaxID=46680 RepID=UPI003B977BC4
MAIPRLSIQWRITLLVGMCLLMIVGVLISTSLYRTNESTALVKERSSSILEDSAQQRLKAEGAVQSLAVQRYLLASYQVGLSLSLHSLELRQLAQQQRLEPAILRRNLTDQVKATLQANPQLLSLYLVFQPNALDGNDASFIGQAGLGSNEVGRFSIYWAQRDGQMSSMATSEALITDSTPVLDGSPFSTWFDCPRTTRKPCLLSPYFDDASGKRTLITTLSFPVIENGKVIAIAGMDISLANLQELA